MIGSLNFNISNIIENESANNFHECNHILPNSVDNKENNIDNFQNNQNLVANLKNQINISENNQNQLNNH